MALIESDYNYSSIMNCIYSKKRLFHVIFLITISFFFVSTLSVSTTFLYPDFPWGDSAIFQVIGRSWANGLLPYVDAWDLKGPYVFFVNFIGYSLNDSKYGIFIIQVLFMIWTTHLIYQFYHIKFGRLSSYSLMILTLIILVPNYSAGNTVNEYCLPFLLGSFILLYQWANNSGFNYPHLSGFIYGITWGICLMSRLTNALGLSFAILFVVVVLVLKREFPKLLSLICFFLLGLVLSVGPFMLYFAANEAIDELLYGTLLFNMEHVGSRIFHYGTGYYVVHFGFCFLCLCFFISEIFISKKRKNGVLWAMASIPVFFWFSKSNGFTHYAIIAIPYVCITILEAKDIFSLYRFTSMGRYFLFLCLFVLVVSCSFNCKSLIDKQLIKNNTQIVEELYRDVCKSDKKASFIAYNVNPKLYLEYKILPISPYFSLQDEHYSQSDTFKKRLHDNFAQLKAEWIMVRGENVAISDILHANYSLYQQEGEYALYRLKQ